MTALRELRAADADRQATADRLHAALTEGRLDLGDYDQRLRLAYSATSYSDLDRLTADLPAPAPPAPPGLPLTGVPRLRAVAGWICGMPVGCLIVAVLLIVAILG